MSVTIAGLPAGATLSAATDNGDGTFTLDAAALSGLTVTPPVDSSDDFNLTVTAFAASRITGLVTDGVPMTAGVSVHAVADMPNVSADDITLIDLGAGDDVLFGGDDNDTLRGELDNDQIFGEAGNDILIGAEGKDTLWGGTGNDLIIGEEGADLLYGGDGDDNILGGSGGDLLDGGAGNDLLRSEGGGDQLIGGAGVDVMIGKGGSDRFIFDLAAVQAESGIGAGNRDIIQDFEDGEDTIELTGAVSFNFVGDETQAFLGGGASGRFNNQTKVLEIDADGDQVSDMEIELQSVDGANLDDTDFTVT